MELIDRYVYEVGRHLPRRNRADIKAELHSTLVDTLEAQVEGEPSEDDVVAMLQEYGSPQKVAATYWPEGQYLIGPSLFPLFKMVVGIALLVFVIVQLVLLGVAVVFDQEVLTFLSILDILGETFGSLFTAFGVIVIVFAVLQYFEVKPDTEEEGWDPRQLPAVEQEETISRGGRVAEITIGLVFIAILLFLPDYIGFVVSPGMEVILNPVLISYIPLIILALLISIGLDVILLWRGRWETGTRLAKIGTNLFGMYVLYVLLAGHNAWLAEQGASGFFSFIETLPELATPNDTSVAIIGMHAFRLAFIIALIVTAVDTVRLIYQLLRSFFSPAVAVTYTVEGGKNGT